MKNKEVSKLLYEIADFLEMNDIQWKPRAYRRAARNIESLSEDIQEIHSRGELENIDGVGEAIAGKIEEYLETGSLDYYDDLKRDLPVDIEALTSVEGVGPKTVKRLYQELEIEDLDDLEKAAERGKIADLEGFGDRTQENILEHIEMAKRGQERMLLGDAAPIAREFREKLEASSDFNKVEIVGSFRRRKPTVGDVDILATSEKPLKAMGTFCNFKDVKEILDQGETKSSVLVSGDLQVDLRIVDEESWGSALIYFTGSKDHNIALRSLAIEKDWKLNEYGLMEEGEKIASKNEDQVYDRLGLEYIPPELREDEGEVEAAQERNLPDLVEEKDMRGDLQMHAEFSDGRATLEELARKADEKGLEYISLTEHGSNLAVAGGPEGYEEWMEVKQEVERVNEEFDVEVLFGAEANLTKDGIDIDDKVVEELDLLVVAMHNRVENPTDALIQVFEDYPVDILAHPLNRKINERKPLDIDMERVIEKAADENILIEINSQPARLDLPWNYVKRFRDAVDFVVSTDAHSTGELDYMHLGVSQARRGWLEKSDVINTKNLDELRSYLN